MTKIIALSGVGNTGKSTLINSIVKKGKEEGIKILGLEEIAREVMQTISPNEMKLFQQEIMKLENERVDFIKKIVQEDLYDIIVCDRAWSDCLAYTYFNISKGKIAGDMALNIPEFSYDKVYFFDTPIKETGVKNFSHYNDEQLSQLLAMTTKSIFPNVQLYQNGIIDGKKITEDIFQGN